MPQYLVEVYHSKTQPDEAVLAAERACAAAEEIANDGIVVRYVRSHFVREDETVRFAPVRRGAELGGDVLVLDGVETGQIVATEGAYLLRSLYLKLSGGGEAHEH